MKSFSFQCNSILHTWASNPTIIIILETFNFVSGINLKNVSTDHGNIQVPYINFLFFAYRSWSGDCWRNRLSFTTLPCIMLKLVASQTFNHSSQKWSIVTSTTVAFCRAWIILFKRYWFWLLNGIHFGLPSKGFKRSRAASSTTYGHTLAGLILLMFDQQLKLASQFHVPQSARRSILSCWSPKSQRSQFSFTR